MKALALASIIIIAALASAVPSNAATYNDVFKKAALLYTEGKYDEAAKEYYKPIQDGYESGGLYYNIGNCYLKTNRIGYAILYYEKARRLIPVDEDLRANYEFAVSQIKNRQSAVERPWVNRQLDRLYSPLTTDALTICLFILYATIFAAAIARLFIVRLRGFAIYAIAVAAVLLIISSYVLYDRQSGVHSIVLAEKIEARYEPFDGATVFYTMYAGMRVDVVETEGQWYKIKRPDGKTGWAHKGDIGVI
ncbi:MAG: SH3 domain-containing protein [Candidatus Magnetominusculus sp. LBB02]|nr:SH3 domain-containing protein [Candidatus Magnetominusculus sp. LBB02]